MTFGQPSADEEKEPFGWQFFFFGVVLIAMAAWTIYIFADAWLVIRALNNDATGAVAWQFQLLSGLATPAQEPLFLEGWKDPAARQQYIAAFQASFWKARLQFWVIPFGAFGLVAILLKPRS